MHILAHMWKKRFYMLACRNTHHVNSPWNKANVTKFLFLFSLFWCWKPDCGQRCAISLDFFHLMSPVGPLRPSPADPGVLCWWLWPVLGGGQKAWLSTLTGSDGFQWVWPFNIHPKQLGQQYTCRHCHCFSQIKEQWFCFWGVSFSCLSL